MQVVGNHAVMQRIAKIYSPGEAYVTWNNQCHFGQLQPRLALSVCFVASVQRIGCCLCLLWMCVCAM